MSVLQQDFDSYELWANCGQVQALIEKALGNVDKREFTAFHRLSEAVVAVAELRNVAAWRFPDPNATQLLHGQIVAVQAPLQNLVDNPELDVRDQIEAHLTQISSALLNCPSPGLTPSSLSEVASLTERYRQGVGDAIDRARQSSTDAEAEMQKVVDAKDAAITSLTDQLEELKTAIGTEKADVSAQAARLDTALTTNNTAFSAQMTEWQDRVTGALKEAKESSEQQVKAGRDEADEHVNQLVDLERQSRKLTEATARNSISTEYGTHAKRQDTAATIWSVGAVVLAVGGLVALFAMINGIATLTAPEAIWKTSVSALTLAIATYMGREAAGHRKDARDAKRTQLDLNALEPFLANMDELKAHELREQFAKQIFGRPLANSKDHGGFSWTSSKEANEGTGKAKESEAAG